jgi:hypothetical protein
MLDLLGKWKLIGLALAGLLALGSAIYWQGCSKGKELGREEMQQEVNEWKGKYLNLRDAPPKIETRTVTRFVEREPSSGRSTATPVESEEENPLAIPKTTTIRIESPGMLNVTFFPLELPAKQFLYYLDPEPMRIDTVIVTETKWAVEYRDVNVFAKLELYVCVAIAAVGGYALAGGF